MSLALCVVGPLIAMRVFAKVRRSEKLTKAAWLAFASLAAGATFWSVNFLLLISANIPVHLGKAEYFAFALGFSIIGTFIGLSISAFTERSFLIEVGGSFVGLIVLGTQLLIIWAISPELFTAISFTHLAAAMVVSVLFGAMATNRIARPVTRFCKYGGGFALICSIVLCYLCIVLGISTEVAQPTDTPSFTQMLGVVSVASLLIFAAAAAYFIDARNLRDASYQMQEVSQKDPLTGLVNHQGFEQLLTTTVTQLHDDTASIAVAVIEISQIKEINAAHGIAAGDAVLNTVASRLSQALGENEFLGKFTGNRFLAIKFPIFHKSEAQKFCDRIQREIAQPISWNENDLNVGFSAGIALFPHHGKLSRQLIEHADLAALRARELSDKKVTIYNPQIDDQKKSRNMMAIDLRAAISKGELELNYQRQNDVSTGDLVGFESLMRWRHPEQGMVSPGIFIPIAEESSLIVELGEWALRTACAEAASWDQPLSVAVNVAARQLEGTEFPKLVEQVLDETGLDPTRLELEITESGIIHDQEQALHTLKLLKELGCKVAMDDFGTGHSSLSTLQAFPFDKLKVDREFIKDIELNDESTVILRATIAIADSMDLKVLAEGAETAEHIDVLKRCGCNLVQGFYFGKPLTTTDLKTALNDTAVEGNTNKAA
ncbi:MAG: EAL domain-containing protein [Gammaproteobacteria bacterium]|nr:EAL domain-containing protein [Gammaproteobacteria bacterium]